MLKSERKLSVSTENESTNSNEKNLKQRLPSKFNEQNNSSHESFSSTEIEEDYNKENEYEEDDDYYDEYDWTVKVPKIKMTLKPAEKKKEENKDVTAKTPVKIIAPKVVPVSEAKEEEKEEKPKEAGLDHKITKLLEAQEKLNPLYQEDPEVNVNLSPYEMIVGQFAEAGIELRLVSRPTEFSTDRAAVEKDLQNFLMDIRTKLRGQHIIIYPGVNTRFEVVDINRELHQLILVVQEPERIMKVTRKVFRHKLGQYINVTNTVTSPSEERTFLIGMDDGHLFACRLKENAVTVTQAHKSLKPAVIKKRGDNYFRQGEWFFVRAGGLMNFPERRHKHRRGFEVMPEGKLTIGRGRPHIAQEAITIDKRTYVRGEIKHPDHKTLYFNEWYQVFSNNEKREIVVARGLTWFD